LRTVTAVPLHATVTPLVVLSPKRRKGKRRRRLTCLSIDCRRQRMLYPPIGALCWDSLLRPYRVQSRKFCAERLRGTKAGGCGPTRLADAGSWHLLAVCRVCLASPDDAAVLLA